MRRNALTSMNRRSAVDAEVAFEGDLHNHAGLRALVDAACGPAQASEMGGLPAAVAAFRAPARQLPSPDRRPRHAGGSIAGRLAASALAVKIMLACLGAAALGGLAYAGVNGKLPGTASQPSRSSHSTESSGDHPSAHASSTPPGHASASKPASGSTIAPAAALPGLCTSWLASANDPNRASDHRFTKLVNAAGNSADVTPYCSTLLASGSHGNSEHPTKPTHPSETNSPHPTKSAKSKPPKVTPTHSGH